LLCEVALRAKLQGCVTVQIDASEHEGPYGAALALASQLAWLLPEAAGIQAAELAQQNPAQMRALHRLAPELCDALGLRAPSVRPLPSDDEPTRERAHCLSALHDLICGLARQRPLAILVDDVHRADEASLSVLGMLAHDARNLKLLLVAARRTGDEALSESNLHALIQLGATFELGPLPQRQLLEWLSSVFADAPNLGRLANFLHERTRGRPASVTALLRFLIARGELRYRDGTWVLPNEPAQMPLPADTDAAILDQLQALPEPTRALAEALGMHRGALSLELCAALSAPAQGATRAPLSPEARTEFQARLDTLVGIEVLTLGREGYRVRSEELREKLESRIDASRRTALHLRMGETILARGSQAPLEQLAAGVHLLEAHDDRGLRLTTQAAVALLSRVDGLGGAVRLLERALVIANERGASTAHRLALLGALCLGGYVADHRLVRHQEQLAAALDDFLLLPAARRLMTLGEKLGRYCGYTLALLVLSYSVLRYYAQPRHARPDRFRRVVLWGVSGMVALSGRAALCLDKPAIDRIVERIAPLRALGMRDPGGFAVEYCKGLGIATQDRYGETHALWLRLERALNKPGAMQEVPLEQRRLWVGGISYALGLFESFRGDPIVLQRAEALEASGTNMHAMIAAQLRLQYHGFRGETEQVRRAYERMENCAIQTGSSWQVETWSAISINLFATLWHDVIIAKRAMRETQRMKDDLPSLARYALSSEGTYLLRRGQPRECADVYERLLAAEAPLSRVGWSTCHGLLAEAYNQLGLHAQAKTVCERALSMIAPEDRVYFAMRLDLELAYAVALSGLGEHERATEHLNRLLECYAGFASPLALGSVHETLARIALTRGERKRFTQHLKQVEAHFTKLGNPALIARFQALSDLAGEGGGFVTKVAVMREVRAFDAAIEPIDEPAKGARAILAWLMRTCEGYDGYLFGPAEQPEDEPVLLAATSDKEPGAEVFESVSSSLRELGRDGDTTNLGTGVATQASRDGGPSHLYLLSYLEADEFHAEGALVLLGRAAHAPPVRYELLQAAAQQLRRLCGRPPT
jgi:tetratricopeptide (TPR) repeat protein